MNKLDARFYWDTAKFFFSMVGGGTAGYCLAKGVNSAASKVVQLAEMQVATRLVNTGSDETATNEEALDL